MQCQNLGSFSRNLPSHCSGSVHRTVHWQGSLSARRELHCQSLRSARNLQMPGFRVCTQDCALHRLRRRGRPKRHSWRKLRWTLHGEAGCPGAWLKKQPWKKTWTASLKVLLRQCCIFYSIMLGVTTMLPGLACHSPLLPHDLSMLPCFARVLPGCVYQGRRCLLVLQQGVVFCFYCPV